VLLGSIESPALDQMLAGERVSVLYSDPPWGDGNLAYWATMNKKMTGEVVKPIRYSTLMERIRGLIARYVSGHVFIETGVRWEQETIDALAGAVYNVRSYRTVYKSGSNMLPNVILVGTTSPSIPRSPIDPSGMSGVALPTACVRSVAVPGGILLDPCCGMGYSARAAVAAGMVFRGNELNAKRLAKTVRFLEGAVGR
jgi:hypothetical protein